MKNEQKIIEQVKYLRNKYYIGIYPNEVEKMCNECDIENALFSDENNFAHISINLVNLGIPEPFHRASLIGLNTDNGPIWFIVDPTYGQFFENEKFKNYMISNYKKFSYKLLKQGYIECNIENMLSYINGFVLSNAYTFNINKDKVYKLSKERF